MHDREREITGKVVEIITEYLDPKKIFLFGSRAKDVNGRHSDFDFAVDCPRPPDEIQKKIEKQISDISGLYKVDLIYLKSIDEDFRKIIEESGKVIYEQ